MSAYRRLFAYAAPYRTGWFTLAVAALASTAFSLLQPWPLKILVDHVLADVPTEPALAALRAWLPGAESRVGLLAWVVAAGLIVFLATMAAEVVLSIVWTRVGRRTVYGLARDLFARTQRRSLVFHHRHPIGDSLSRITGDAWCVHTIVDTLLFAPGHALVTLVVMLVIMLRLDPGLTLMALLVAPLMAASALAFGRPLRAATHVRREIESRIQAHIHQTLTGIPVVQAFARESVEEQRFHEFAGQAIRAHQRSALIESAYGLGSGLSTTLGTAAVLWVAAMRVLEGHLTIGGTLVFLSYLGTLQAQFTAFTNVYASLQEAGASVDRVTQVFDADERVTDRPDALRLPPVRGHVRIENVTAGYLEGQPVLRDVDLEAAPGETLAIVGHTGAGKSTLVSLIPRFFDPWQGRVLIDGHDITQVQLESLRRQIAIVLQEPFLFPLTVEENIRFGRPDAPFADVEAAARAANAHDFISRLRDGYQTVLGERGATLSGGERQRVAIARALLKDAPVLILDEPTSALDVETEYALLEALTRLMAGRTTFVIAHRLSTIRGATRIAVLDAGRVVEQGTHDDLLARRGRYSDLYRRQATAAEGLPA